MRLVITTALAVAASSFVVTVADSSQVKNCCKEGGEACCSDIIPSISDLALHYRLVYDEEACCPHPTGALLCAPYDVGGCRLCKDDCGVDEERCVTCTTTTDTTDEDSESKASDGGGSESDGEDDSLNKSQGDAEDGESDSTGDGERESDNGNGGCCGEDGDHVYSGLGSDWTDDMEAMLKPCSSGDNDLWEDYDLSLSYSYGFEDDDDYDYDVGSGSRSGNGSGSGSDNGSGSDSGSGSGSGSGSDSDNGSGSDSGSRSRSGSRSGSGSGDIDGDDDVAEPRGSKHSACSMCSSDSMTTLEKRLLKQRSRSLVCDSTCLTSHGHTDYGVNLCNYFNAGRECRACCNEDSMFSGCMPCVESCRLCTARVLEVCSHDPCGAECQAFICCAQRWSDTSDCEDALFPAVAEVADKVSDMCRTVLTCETPDLTCSESSDMCTADGSFGRDIKPVEDGTCPKITLHGAGNFDMEYVLKGTHDGQLVFWSYRDGTTSSYVLQSVVIDICAADVDTTITYGKGNMEKIFSDSKSGILAWQGGLQVNASSGRGGEGGCTRHIWYFQDMSRASDHTFVAVDPCGHPRYITSDWVEISSAGGVSLSELELSCGEQSTTTRSDRALDLGT